MRRDWREARQAAKRNTQHAVRAFARDPNADNADSVAKACARVRMLDEMHLHERGERSGG